MQALAFLFHQPGCRSCRFQYPNAFFAIKEYLWPASE
jgi:hypothetical protein